MEELLIRLRILILAHNAMLLLSFISNKSVIFDFVIQFQALPV